MCPFRYLTHVLLFLLSNAILASSVTWKAVFDPDEVRVKTGDHEKVHLVLEGLDDDVIANINDREYIQIKSENEARATVDLSQIKFFLVPTGNRSYDANFDVNGVFLGLTKVFVQIKNKANELETSDEKLDVIVLRPRRFIDKMFVWSVAILVSILYINFGAAINLSTIQDILRRPVGPIILFVCQFLFMPLAAYGLGYWLFQDAHEMALGLFFTGISPGGGASNMWTLLLGGNINLSIALTTISTLSAFFMMPLWIFTLGSTIFERAELGVPYGSISQFAIGLIIPLAVGLAIQRFLPKTAKFLVRVLKPVSLVLILFIVIFAIITNLYIFQLFSWQIILAGLGLPWFGYSVGWLTSKIFRQSNADTIAIAVETGIQNTGVAIFLLTFSLEQPAADLTTVVPVSVAIMTPFPLLGLYLLQKLIQFKNRKDPAAMKQNDAILESDQSSSSVY